MRKLSAEEIVSLLSEAGSRTSRSTLVHEGDYSIADADWNYKDIPHLNELHNQVDGIPTVIGTDIITTVFLQRVGPFRVPLTVVNYAVPNGQVYYTSFGPMILVVSTTWVPLEANRTRVTTTYTLCSSRVFRPAHALVHWVLGRNYRTLMSADIPMREQRGKLRAHGYTFTDDLEGYTFSGTLRIAENNLLDQFSRPSSVLDLEIRNLSVGRTVCKLDEVRGIVVERVDDQILIFDRICSHEGAPLDDAALIKDCVRCPWHGRSTKPLTILNFSSLRSGDVYELSSTSASGRMTLSFH